MTTSQISIDFDYDERVVRLASEFAIMLAPYLSSGTKKETAQLLAGRLAMLASKQLSKQWEPEELIRCHTCDVMTTHKDRARVVVCPRCSLEGRSPGCRV